MTKDQHMYDLTLFTSCASARSLILEPLLIIYIIPQTDFLKIELKLGSFVNVLIQSLFELKETSLRCLYYKWHCSVSLLLKMCSFAPSNVIKSFNIGNNERAR